MPAHRKKDYRPAPPKYASAFITLHFQQSGTREKLRQFGQSKTQQNHARRTKLNADNVSKTSFRVITTATPKSDALAPPSSPHIPLQGPTEIPPDPEEPPDMKTRGAWDKNLANSRFQAALGDVDFDSVQDGSVPRSGYGSASRRQDSFTRDTEEPVEAVKRRRTSKQRFVRFDTDPDALLDQHPSISTGLPSPDIDTRSEKENQDEDDDMEPPSKPKLKLSFGKTTFSQPTSSSPPASTPTLKLKLGGNKDKDGGKKKRKRTEDDVGRPMATPVSAGPPKIKFKAAAAAHTPITPGGIKLQTKGRIPKRLPGVGYDSELTDRELDPVILEGMMLRMQPGPDCDYIRDAINKGTMGVHKLQGGANVAIRVLDDKGRRCIVQVRDNNYAATLVDLPCLIEGMKSWDNKRFIKSVDVCQMMLVLGRIKNDEEAKTYPLPDGVNPKTYTYAHGITAPMQWVRKRRFDRTRRVPVDEIESIDRRVNQLLQADATASSVSYEILDHDPRLDDDQYSESESDEQEEDADGEEDENYFGYEPHPDDQHHVKDTDVDDFTAMFDDDEDTAMAEPSQTATNGHYVDSSGFATSNADSPDVTDSAAPTTAPTPAAEGGTPAGQSAGGDDSDDENDDDGDHAEQNEQDEKKTALRERIQSLQAKIDEQMIKLASSTSGIMKKRLAQNIKSHEGEVSMLKRELAGGKNGSEDGDGDSEGAAE